MLRNCAELKRALAIGAILLTPGCNLDSLFGHDGARVQVVLSRDGGSGLGAIVANMVQDSVAARNDDDDDHHRVGTWGFQTATVTLASILARTLDGELSPNHHAEIIVRLDDDFDWSSLERCANCTLPV
jgi:hypothetical protein